MSRLSRLTVFACIAVFSVIAGACGASISEQVLDSPAQGTRTPGSASADDLDLDAVQNGDESAPDLETVEAPPTPTTPATPTANAARTQGAQATQPAPVQSGPVNDITEIDFENFAYSGIADWIDQPVMVVGGLYETPDDSPLEDRFALNVSDVEFGDFDDDGNTDAAVTTQWNGGGSGWFSGVSFFRLVNGMPELVQYYPFGDRAHGGIADTIVNNDALSVWSFSTTGGACCPDEIRESILVMGSQSVAEAVSYPTRSYLRFDGPQDTNELKFLPGTSSGMVAAYPFSNEGTFIVDALAGQRLEINVVNGPAPALIVVTHQVTGAVQQSDTITTANGLVARILPLDGIYEVTMSWLGQDRDHDTLFEVAIDQPAPTQATTWATVLDENVITQDPFVRVTIAKPVFSSDLAAADQANQALDAAVDTLANPWIEDVTTFSEPQDDSSLEVSYSIALASDDLVSVEMYYFDYVCCRPYPNYGTLGVTLDLTTGQALTADQIVDVNRLGDVTAIWLAALVEQQSFLDEAYEDILGTNPVFDAVVVYPNGLKFSTRRGALGGGLPGTTTFVSFAELGDLVSPDIVTRAQAGYTPVG